MEFTVPAPLARFADLIHAQELVVSVGKAAVLVGSILVAIYLLELWSGRDRANYRTRNFLNDLAYLLFYQGGFYQVFIWAAFANALGPRLSFFKVEMLANLPAPVHWVLYWLTLDFLEYWWHRLRHHSSFLWAFHAVHHSAEHMTSATSWRNHPVEQIFGNLITFIPLLVLGIPPGMWFPLVVVQYAYEALQHSQLDWRYGAWYRIFVSPVFHSIHHSTERRLHDRNYGKMFSFWDFVFGTGVEGEPRPVVTGISGPPIPESIPHQLVSPFIRLLPRSAPVPSAPSQPRETVREA